MPASLLIKLLDGAFTLHRDIDIYLAEEWTPETQVQLLQQAQDILHKLRSHSQSLHLIIEVKVGNLEEVASLISAKNTTQSTISVQHLTRREMEVLPLIMNGFTNAEITKSLFITCETVKSHRKHILEKTKAKNTAALIHYYHQTFFEK